MTLPCAPRVAQLLQEMARKRIQPDVVVFNAAITACEKGRAWQTALRLMDQMQEVSQISLRARRARASHHNIACKHACVDDKGSCVSEAFQMHPQMGIRPTCATYGAAISACQKGAQWQKALALLAEMSDQNVKPNAIVYSAAISACGRAGEWEAALDLLDEMGTLGIPRNTICYNAAIQACANGLAWEHALKLFDRMKAVGIERNRVTYNAVARACDRAGQEKLAFDVRMQAAALNELSDSAAAGAGSGLGGTSDGDDRRNSDTRRENSSDNDRNHRKLLRDHR